MINVGDISGASTGGTTGTDEICIRKAEGISICNRIPACR
jgi:hypothetical protein